MYLCLCSKSIPPKGFAERIILEKNLEAAVQLAVENKSNQNYPDWVVQSAKIFDEESNFFTGSFGPYIFPIKYEKAISSNDIPSARALIRLQHLTGGMLDPQKSAYLLRVPIHHHRNEFAESLIVDYNADIHAWDEFGRNALHNAVEAGNKEMVILLLEKFGADIKAQTDAFSKLNAIQMAVFCEQKSIIDYLFTFRMYAGKNYRNKMRSLEDEVRFRNESANPQESTPKKL
jgi:hypothetical protein